MIFTIARKTIGCLFSLLFLFFLLAGTLVVAGYFMLPTYLEYKLEKQTGYRADLGEVNLDILEGSLEIEGAKIDNPISYPETDFLDINRIKMDLRPMSLLGERCIFQEVVIDVEQLAFVTGPASENNIAGLIKALELATAEDEEDEGVTEEPLPFLIERLSIKLDSIKVANYSGQSPSVKNHDADIDIELRDVTDVKEIIQPLVAELSRQGLVFVLKGVVESLNREESYKGLLQWTAEAIEDSVKSILEGADETGQTVKKIIEKLIKK